MAREPGGQHNNRHGIGICLRDAAEGILRARAVLHREDADLIAGGDAADRVCHVQARPLLAHDDRADIRLGGRLDDRVDRIANKELHPFALENLGNGVDDLHGVPSLSAVRDDRSLRL